MVYLLGGDMEQTTGKIKITFCMYQIITGGIEKALIRILEQLITYNKYEFTIVTMRPVTEQVFLDFFAKNNIPVHMFDKKSSRAIFRESDIIVDYFNCAFCDKLRHVACPVIGWYHSGFIPYSKNLVNNNRNYAFTYDRFVCLTKSFWDEMQKYPNIAKKTLQIYNPFDLNQIRDMADMGKTPADGEKYFVFLGRLHSDKDHMTVINAFDKFAANTPDAKMYFIGDGDYLDKYKSEIESRGLGGKIILTGVMDNPFGYIKNATANILSSPSEGLSNVLVEGAALGTLNIASNCPSGPAEILMDGQAGLLFPVGDSRKLAQIMDDVWNENVDANQMIQNASNAITRFDAENITAQFVHVIDELARKNKKIKICNIAICNRKSVERILRYLKNPVKIRMHGIKMFKFILFPNMPSVFKFLICEKYGVLIGE